MVKRTLHLSNPAHICTRNEQLVLELRNETKEVHTFPIEDLGILVLEHPQISLTANLLEKLMEKQVAVITCNSQYLPSGMFLPLDGHSEQTGRIRTQLEASIPLKKQLWQQTVRAKIQNQAEVLLRKQLDNKRLLKIQNDVMSGDSGNCEAIAAAFYWGQLYGMAFTRSRGTQTPNGQLNFGYAIVRSMVARALTASGMFPSIGINHRNKYNAFCLADDIMEPYRAFVDWTVLHLPDIENTEEGMTKEQKVELLKLPQMDVMIGGLKRPMFHAVSMTSASLYACFEGSQRKIVYPEFVV
jgi:CRISPR-associated protein Cas1